MSLQINGFHNKYDLEQYRKRARKNLIPSSSKWLENDFFELLLFIESKCKGWVLDVGCGQGEFVLHYNKAFGIDQKRFETWGKDRRFRVCKAEKLDAREVETVLFNNSFEHFENKGEIIDRLRDFPQVQRIIFVLPTAKHLIKGWLRLPKALLLKVLGEKHEDIRYLLVHSFNVYGFDFVRAFVDFSSWERTLWSYIRKRQVFKKGHYLIIVFDKRGR